MPTPTDLVTDLPADFEVFGQAVDTSLADLKGGTTGQVLSKNSNTDMDFVWVTDAAGDITGVTAGTGISGGGTSGTVTITNSMATEITAKGDLIVGTGSATFDNLAAGSNGSTLVADSAATTGLRYSATPSASNPIINSSMQNWQRGTSIACSSTAYTADRWQGYRTVAGATVSRQTTSDTTNLPFIQYAARVQRDSANTSTTAIFFAQSLESVNSIPFIGKVVTVSFYARSGANYSSASSALSVITATGTGTDQNVLTSYTGANNFISQTATLTTTWQRFSYSGTVPSTGTELGTYFYYTPVGTAGAADYFEVTGVQIDVGSVALPFRTYAATIQGELAACQRYYIRMGGTAAFEYLGAIGNAGATTNADVMFVNIVPMRTTPSAIEYSLLSLYDGVAIPDCTAISALYSSPKTQFVRASASSLTQYRNYQLIARNSTSAYLAFSAEL